MTIKSLSHPYYTRICETSVRVPKSGRILDVGCADGYLDTFLKKKGKVYGVDINETELEIAKLVNPEIKYRKADITALPFEDNSFGAVTCLEVLEHVPDDSKAVSELSRVLKKRGRLVITVPHDDYPSSFDIINYALRPIGKHLPIGVWAYGHIRLYSRKGITSLLEKNGLKIKEVYSLSHFLVGLIEPAYLINLIQPLFKSDSRNKSGSAKNIEALKKRLLKEPPEFLKKLRDRIISLDKRIFGKTKSSLGLLVAAEK